MGLFQMHKLLVLKNDIEVAQFQSNSPRYLPLSEELWKALVKLPSVYNYAAYRELVQRFGTHYVSEGSLGGTFTAVAKIDEETQRYMSEDSLTNINFIYIYIYFLLHMAAFNCLDFKTSQIEIILYYLATLFLSVFITLKQRKAVSTTSVNRPNAGFCSSPSRTLNAKVAALTKHLQPVLFLFLF